MSITFERIKETAKKRKMTLIEVNEKAGLGNRTIYNWRHVQPTINSLNKVAKVLDVTTNYLLGVTSDPRGTTKNQKDIQVMLQDVTSNLNNKDTLLFLKNGGEELSKEDAELLKTSLEGTLKLSQQLANQRRQRKDPSESK